MGKATDFEFGSYIHRVHPNKSPLKIWEKSEHGRIEGLPKFLEYTGTPIISGTGKVANFTFSSVVSFTARCTLPVMQSAVLRLHVVCLSVCLSVCGSGLHRLEVLETNYKDN